MSPQIIVALIGVLSAAVIVPLVKKLYFDVQRTLRVSVRYFPVVNSKYVERVFDERFKSLKSSEPEWHWIIELARAKQRTEFEIENTSKKRIDGVSLKYQEIGNAICQINDADDLRICKQDEVLVFGSLQPGHKHTIQIWSNGYHHKTWPYTKESFQISADELDRVRYKHPAPGYIRWLIKYRMLVVFYFVSGLLVGALCVRLLAEYM